MPTTHIRPAGVAYAASEPPAIDMIEVEDAICRLAWIFEAANALVDDVVSNIRAVEEREPSMCFGPVAGLTWVMGESKRAILALAEIAGTEVEIRP